MYHSFVLSIKIALQLNNYELIKYTLKATSPNLLTYTGISSSEAYKINSFLGRTLQIHYLFNKRGLKLIFFMHHYQKTNSFNTHPNHQKYGIQWGVHKQNLFLRHINTIYKVLSTFRNTILHVMTIMQIPLKVNFVSTFVNINLPSMMARWRGVASSHCGFLLLMSIRGFCRRMVTKLTLPLLAAA